MAVVVFSLLFFPGAINVGSALGKILAEPRTLEHLALAEIPRSLLIPLAIIQLVGTALLVLGMVNDYRDTVITVATCFSGYYFLAIARHLQVGHYRGIPAPLFTLAISVAATSAVTLT